jgi:small subunit ribosomal protein S21
MIIIKVDNGIEKAIKSLKNKFQKIGILKELRKRKEFKKKSILRKDEIKTAIYRQDIEPKD